MEPEGRITPEQQALTPSGYIYIQRLEEAIARLKSLVETLSSQAMYMPEKDRRILVSRIGESVAFIVVEFRGLSRNRGEEDQFRREISAVVSSHHEEGFNKTVATVRDILITVRQYQEKYGMLQSLSSAARPEDADIIWTRVLIERQDTVARRALELGLVDDENDVEAFLVPVQQVIEEES